MQFPIHNWVMKGARFVVQKRGERQNYPPLAAHTHTPTLELAFTNKLRNEYVPQFRMACNDKIS